MAKPLAWDISAKWRYLQDWIEIMKLLLEILRPLGIDESQIPKVFISGLSVNSKSTNQGDLFIAIKGTNENGHSYITDAISSGAAAVITNNSYTENAKVPIIKVKNTRKASIF